MKSALIAGGVPPGRIVDLAHDLPAHGIREAAFLLRAMARGFPARSVHLVVVDPGVGGRRAPVVVETGKGPFLVGPDNGVLYPLARDLGLRSTRRIDIRRLAVSPRVGTTFDGRDLFAPAAAALARGATPAELGPKVALTSLQLAKPRRLSNGFAGEVVHVDRFGNLITNVPSSWWPRSSARVELRVGSRRVRDAPFATSYEALGRGLLGVLASSFGLLEVAVGEDRAAERLRAKVGTPVAFVARGRAARRGENANSARPRNRP
jgi:S-adenosyl-L-methionine hydrolase (adenosine-forming)